MKSELKEPNSAKESTVKLAIEIDFEPEVMDMLLKPDERPPVSNWYYGFWRV